MAEPKPLTRAQLEAQLAELQARLAEANGRLRGHEEARRQAAREMDDLKERLASSEAENQRMRGYIARVQEDDVVREELVPTGDPAGEQRLVPKRQPTEFFAPSPYQQREEAGRGYGGHMMAAERREKPRHWVTYGRSC